VDFAEQLRILQAAKDNPALLALATVDLAHHALCAAERARIKDALLAAAIPHWYDRDFLASLLETTPEESNRLLGQLRTLTVVEPFPARGKHAVNVHEAARLALREHLRASNVPLWEALSARARAHLLQRREPHARIEALFHLFATDQSAAAAECDALNREFAYGTVAPEIRLALALALRELMTAGWLTGAAEVEALLCPLQVRSERGGAAHIEPDVRRLVALAHTASHPSGVGRAQCLLGDVLEAKGRGDDALVSFREYLATFQRLALADPSNADWQADIAWAHSRIGGVLQARATLTTLLSHSANTSPSFSTSHWLTPLTLVGSANSPSPMAWWAATCTKPKVALTTRWPLSANASPSSSVSRWLTPLTLFGSATSPSLILESAISCKAKVALTTLLSHSAKTWPSSGASRWLTL